MKYRYRVERVDGQVAIVVADDMRFRDGGLHFYVDRRFDVAYSRGSWVCVEAMED